LFCFFSSKQVSNVKPNIAFGCHNFSSSFSVFLLEKLSC
jgi:hypothetical protein